MFHQRRYEDLFHSIDILPTILSAAAVLDEMFNLTTTVDGVSHWNHFISKNMERKEPAREYMIYNIDDEFVPEIFHVQNRTYRHQVCCHT